MNTNTIDTRYSICRLKIDASGDGSAIGQVWFNDGARLGWRSRRKSDGTWSSALHMVGYPDLVTLSEPRALNLARELRRRGVFSKRVAA